MNIKTDSYILEKNLDFIKIYNSQLVEKIINIKEITKPVEFLESKSGDIIFSYDGLIIDDEIDPIDWASQIFDKLNDNDQDNIYVVFGLGLGYVFKKFVQTCKGKVILFDSNLEILRLIFELVDFSEELQKQNVFVVNSMKELIEIVNTSFTFGVKILAGSLESYAIMHPELFKEILTELERVNPAALAEGFLKVNIGAGNWKKDEWKTLDCYLDADIKADLRKCKPLLIKDNQLEKVFSSHCIEHIETHHLEYLFKELYRCMKPGAIMRLVCPDADLAFEAYKNNDIKWFEGIYTIGEIGKKLVNTFVSYEMGQGGPIVSEEEVKEKFESLTKDEFIDWAISLCDRGRPYIAHINGIYYEKLEKLLKAAGFVNIEKSSYRNSRDEELKGAEFDLHPTVSLYVECNKPN